MIPPAVEFVAYRSAAGRWVLTAAILGSGLVMLDGTVVNVALRTIGADLDADLSQLQWIINGYLLSLSSFILLGGSLGDRYGRRRMFSLGVLAFAVTSVMCAVAPTAEWLIVARVLQGAAGALVTPGSLAIIQSVMAPDDRAPAIGAWSGLGGIAAAVGPLVGGLLIDYASWRWIFLINVPIAAVTLWVAARHVPETSDPEACPSFDVLGAALGAVALGGVTYALIEWGGPVAAPLGLLGLLAGVAFVRVERRSPFPMLPLGLFRSRVFSAANLMTLLVYGALGAVLFFLVLQLQTTLGWSALEAGLATLPITVVMLLLAAQGGHLATRIGPRIPMTVGPVVMAAGVTWLLALGPGDGWGQVLPGMVVFSLGLAVMVAPLTATVLAAAPDRRAGIASGVNNAVARTGSLLAVAALPTLVGLSGDDYSVPEVFTDGYQLALGISAGLLVTGALVSWLAIPRGVQPAFTE